MSSVSSSGWVPETIARLRRLKRAVERVVARIQFALQRKKRVSPLAEEQVRQYHRDGYLLVPGLIPAHLVSAAESAMWQCLEADARSPETWGALGPHPHVLRDRRFIATYTDVMLAAAAQLAGEDVASFRRPAHAFTINRVPVSGDWQMHEPHLDCSIPRSRYRTSPRPYRIGAMTYLTDVERHGGGTIVWPGSHLKTKALASADPGKYKFLSSLNSDLGRVVLGSAAELTPSRGDVLFHHFLCVHACSVNVHDTPRLAINYKW